MTLLEILPSIGKAAPLRFDPAIWPVTACSDEDGRLCVGDVPLTDIADEFRTPTYVIDETDFRHRACRYRRALPGVEIVYAGKSLLTTAVARWAREEGLGVDVCSAGELATALAGGVEPARIIMHGNAKSPDELRDAVTFGVGRIVVDSAMEIAYLAGLARRRQRVLIRVTPDVDIHGHPAVTTGISNQKFGFTLQGDRADVAVQRVLAHPILDLVGLHCHIGSQVTDAARYGEAIHRMIAAMADMRARHGVILTELNIGGGHGIPYVVGDRELDLDKLARVIEESLDDACAAAHFPRPARSCNQRPGRCHPVSGMRREDPTRRPHLCCGGRRYERQPAGVAVRGAVHGHVGEPASARSQAACHRGRPALRSGRRDRPRCRTVGRRAPRRRAGGGLHRCLSPQHGVELQHGRQATVGSGPGWSGPCTGPPRNHRRSAVARLRVVVSASAA